MSLSRRNAIRLWLGQGDRIALEREQQSAIDAARGHAPAEPPVPPPAAPERPGFLARLRMRLPFLGRGR